MNQQRIRESIESLQSYCESQGFKGWDPYDALNSPLLTAFAFKNKYLRAGFTQLLRILPINIRPIIGIKKGFNPKGIGLFLESYSKLYSIDPKEEYIAIISFLLDILEETKSKGYKGNCWGYNFPWQSRVVYKPRWTPTIVNTAFIGHALLTCYELTGIESALRMAESIPNFMLSDLNRDKRGDSFCMSYSPVDQEFVHNANMLGASFLVRMGKKVKREDLIDFAHKSLSYSLNKQNSDGSWFFADVSTHQWIDSFHTGFKLESIRWFIDLGEGEQYLNQFKNGVAFYQKRFFLKDGTPKYYHNQTFPIDIHAPSEAIYFFSRFSDKASQDLTETILDWTLAQMQNVKNGSFYFRKGKKTLNKVPYMRWTQAWMMRGLSEYQYNLFNRNQNG